MTIIIGDGFETGNGNFVLGPNAWTNTRNLTGCSSSVVTITADTTGNSGGYFARSSVPGSGSDYTYLYKTLNNLSEIYIRGFFRLNALPAGSSYIQPIQIYGTGDIVDLRIHSTQI